MLLRYQAAPTTTLPCHYRPFNTQDISTPSKSRSFLATPITSPQQPSMSTTPSLSIHTANQSKEDQLMLEQPHFIDSWGTGAGVQSRFLDTLPQRTGRIHKRLSSGSSVASTGPPSPHDHTSPYVQIANHDSSLYLPVDGLDCMSTQPHHHLPKSLPTPTATPTSSTFVPAGYQNAAAMRRMQSGSFDDDASYSMSGPQSVSSMSHNSPATPHTNYEHDNDEKQFSRGETMNLDSANWMDPYLPANAAYLPSAAFSQTMADLFPDRPMQNFAQQTQPNMPHTSSNLSPYRNVNMNLFPDRLQTGREAPRTSSPATSGRGRSPFQYAPTTSPQDRKPVVAQNMIAQSQMSQGSKSVSPKELLLEDPQGDEDNSAMFPEQFDSNMSSFPESAGFYGNRPFSGAQIPQQYSYVNSRRQQPGGSMVNGDQLPDFPAHMVSMETTVEEGPSESSSQQTSSQNAPRSRPDDVSSDSGTYTCTYHGCSLRFDSPARLQKHKREGHRQTSPGAGPNSASAVNLALRNSQAGPHKCERINPQTGKPCSSIFSRPYDLTRHEDTIHNARKQKVRCHLCNEEKTFSRNDALTRHMRVVHPDVTWPGKTRRGKGRSS